MEEMVLSDKAVYRSSRPTQHRPHRKMELRFTTTLSSQALTHEIRDPQSTSDMPQQESDAESPLPSTLGPSDAQPAFLADGYLHDLKQLPELRPIAWKPGKAVPEINNRREKVAACLVATRGVVADKPCTNCARGKGPMANCVSLAPWIHSSCANCHFHGQGYQCSFRSGGARESHT